MTRCFIYGGQIFPHKKGYKNVSFITIDKFYFHSKTETLDMTSERLGEMFKGDSADMCAGKFPLVSMGGRADTSSMHRRGARTPIGVRGNSSLTKFELVEKKYLDFGATPG